MSMCWWKKFNLCHCAGGTYAGFQKRFFTLEPLPCTPLHTPQLATASSSFSTPNSSVNRFTEIEIPNAPLQFQSLVSTSHTSTLSPVTTSQSATVSRRSVNRQNVKRIIVILRALTPLAKMILNFSCNKCVKRGR